MTSAARNQICGGRDAGVGVGFDVHAQRAGFNFMGPNSSNITHGETKSVWLPAKDRMTGVFWTMVLCRQHPRNGAFSPSDHMPDEARKMRGSTSEAPTMAEPWRNSRRSMVLLLHFKIKPFAIGRMRQCLRRKKKPAR